MCEKVHLVEPAGVGGEQREEAGSVGRSAGAQEPHVVLVARPANPMKVGCGTEWEMLARRGLTLAVVKCLELVKKPGGEVAPSSCASSRLLPVPQGSIDTLTQLKSEVSSENA